MQRIGLRYIVVEADTGAIGGNESHEFNVIASSGEGKLLFCDCGYAASDEKAEYSYSPPDTEDSALPIERVMTPNVRTIEQVARFLNVDKSNVVKSLLYKGRDSQIMVLIRGDQELNEAKLRAAMGDQTLVLVPPDEVSKQLGVEAGFVGPAGLPDEFELIADLSVKRIGNAVVGAMERDMHFKNAREGRDFSVKRWEDLKIVREGDPCPKCSQPLQETRGIELGHIFNLGTKYSEAMGALFNSDEGVMKPFIMGCYGWGISRTISAVVEQLHDKDGIIWPRSVTPFEILILPLAKQDSDAFAFADGLYNKLLEKGYEVLIDDRDASPGVKFKDADLIGIPLRITIGRSFSQNKVELKLRDRSADVSVDIIEGTGILLEKIEQLLDAYNPAGRGREEA
jgi:prolyl-tRNA synthetase